MYIVHCIRINCGKFWIFATLSAVLDPNGCDDVEMRTMTFDDDESDDNDCDGDAEFFVF